VCTYTPHVAHIYIHVYVYIYIYLYMSIYIIWYYICMYVCMYVCIHIWLYVHVYMHVQIHGYKYVYMYIIIHIQSYIYIYIYLNNLDASCYTVVKIHRMSIFIGGSFVERAKEPLIIGLFCGKRSASWGILCIFATLCHWPDDDTHTIIPTYDSPHVHVNRLNCI